MGAVKRMLFEAENLATECLEAGDTEDIAIGKTFDLIWAHALDEESVMLHALSMARSIVEGVKKNNS